jgi:hypothetical protein
MRHLIVNLMPIRLLVHGAEKAAVGPVWDLQVHPRDNMLVIATDGRGMWAIDDVAPLQK